MDPSAMKNTPEQKINPIEKTETLNPVEKAKQLKDGNINSAREYATISANNLSNMSKKEFNNKKPRFDKLSKQSGEILQAMLNVKLPIIEDSKIQIADVGDISGQYGGRNTLPSELGDEGYIQKEDNSSIQREAPKRKNYNNINGKELPNGFYSSYNS